MNKTVTTIKDMLWMVALAGLSVAAARIVFGLGAVTGLDDASPWGLWIAFKLGFVALAGGGFTLAGMVVIFHLEAYRPILRRAILLALLGYGSFIVSLLFDLGLPWHIYMPIIHWQHHSVMFEIAWCVMLYFSVLVLEFSPAILEHSWFKKPIFLKIQHLLHTATVPLVITGIVLSTLHQSSLGALFLIMPQRVHPLWYSPLIPVLFFVSAIAAGMMALILEGRIAEKLLGAETNHRLLSNLGAIGGAVMFLYLALRLVDLAWRGVLPGALDGSWQSLLFISEVLLGGLLPAVMLAIPKVRADPVRLTTAAILAIAGIVSQRMSLSLFTMWRPADQPYSPTFPEIILAFAIPASAGLIYFFFAEHLPVFKTSQIYGAAGLRLPKTEPVRTFLQKAGLRTQFIRRSGIAAFAFSLGLVLLPVSGQNGTLPNIPAERALGWTTLTIDSDRDGESVVFPHAAHQERLADSEDAPQSACLICHHLNLPGDEASDCIQCHSQVHFPVTIFDHTRHQESLGGNASCSECHQGEHLARTAVQCITCHAEMVPMAGNTAFNPFAPGFLDAIHTLCRDCHELEAEKRQEPGLSGCAACHSQPANEPIQANNPTLFKDFHRRKE